MGTNGEPGPDDDGVFEYSGLRFEALTSLQLALVGLASNWAACGPIGEFGPAVEFASTPTGTALPDLVGDEKMQ